MKNLRALLFILLAVIVGEIALVLLITFVQEGIFGGISLTYSPWHHIILGGGGTFLAAATAGYLTRWIYPRSYVPVLILSILVVLETTWLISNQKTIDPLWFDMIAGSSLIVGMFLGSYIRKIFPGFLSKNRVESAT